MNIKRFIKVIIRNTPIINNIYMKHEKIKIEEFSKEKNLLLQRNGYKLIFETEEALRKLSELFFFDFGTLLGIVREGKIISHDMDMDIGVNISNDHTIQNVRNILKDIGCKHISENIIHNYDIIGQDTFCKYDIEFDVYYYRDNGEISEVYTLYQDPRKQYLSNQWDVVRLTSPKVSSTILYEFQGRHVHVPEEYEKHLINKYGENWRIPDRNYVYWDSFSTTKINLEGHINNIE